MAVLFVRLKENSLFQVVDVQLILAIICLRVLLKKVVLLLFWQLVTLVFFVALVSVALCTLLA